MFPVIPTHHLLLIKRLLAQLEGTAKATRDLGEIAGQPTLMQTAAGV